MPYDASHFVRRGRLDAERGASFSRDLITALSACLSCLLPVVASCSREPNHSSSAEAAPSSLPSVPTVTRQPGRLVLRIKSADAGAPVEISNATPPAVVIQTVNTSDRERAFRDLFRAHGDVRLELAADRHIPHFAMTSLMDDLRRAGFTHLQFAAREP
jgi:biopolymer transport protein ExbD